MKTAFFESVQSLTFFKYFTSIIFAEHFFAGSMLGCEKAVFLQKNDGIPCCCIHQGS